MNVRLLKPRFSLHAKVVVFVMAALCFGVLGVLLNSVEFHVISALVVGLIGLTSMSAASWSPLDPRVWFSVFGWLYCFSFLLWGLLTGTEVSEFDSVFMLGLVFYLASLSALWLFSMLAPLGRQLPTQMSMKRLTAPGHLLLFSVLAVLLAYATTDGILIMQTGISDKRVINHGDFGLPAAKTIVNWALIVFSFIIISSRNKKKSFWLAIIVGCFAFSYWGMTGQRDVIYKFVLVLSFSLIASSQLRLKWVYLSGVIAVLSVTLTKDLGVAFIERDFSANRVLEGYVGVLGQEWSAAGRNMSLLLQNKDFYEGAGLERLSADIGRGMLPGVFLEVNNTNTWYFAEYLPATTGRQEPGLGFSLHGAFYVYGGVAGVFIGSLVLGALYWISFRAAFKNTLWMSGYIMIVSLSIWALRGDVSYVISSYLKQAFPILMVLWFFSKIPGVFGRVRLKQGNDVTDWSH